MSSLVREVALDAAVVLLATLVLVGLGTATALHLQAREALDQALLAAAHGQAHPEAAEWEVEHSRSPVETWLWKPGDDLVPEGLAALALAREGPVFDSLGDQRLLLLPAELEGREGAHEEEEDEHGRHGGHDKLLVVAAAPRVTLARSVGPFALAYGLVAALAAALAATIQATMVSRALRPLRRARETSARVVRLAQGTRLPVEGPDEVRALLMDLNALLDRLDDAHQAQARFTAEAAHELRTPVTALLGEIELALRRPRDARGYRSALEAMHGDVDRLRSLVEALMVMARLDSGQLDHGREPVRASEILFLARRDHQETLDAAGCSLQLDPGPDPEVRAHPALLAAALGNLLRNAAAYAPGSPVRAWVECGPEQVRFVVEDRGPGVPEAEREAVFERFTRLGPARREHEAGLGLGLPLTREIARRHGGDCHLEAVAGGGCRAVLTIFQSPSQGGRRSGP